MKSKAKKGRARKGESVASERTTRKFREESKLTVDEEAPTEEVEIAAGCSSS